MGHLDIKDQLGIIHIFKQLRPREVWICQGSLELACSQLEGQEFLLEMFRFLTLVFGQMVTPGKSMFHIG